MFQGFNSYGMTPKQKKAAKQAKATSAWASELEQLKNKYLNARRKYHTYAKTKENWLEVNTVIIETLDNFEEIEKKYPQQAKGNKMFQNMKKHLETYDEQMMVE